MTNLALVTPAAALPISILDARAHCRATEADDGILSLYVSAAVQAVEDWTERALITETWRLSLPAWPDGEIILPRAPLLTVTEIRYWTDAAVPVDTVAAASLYQVVAPTGPTAPPGRVMLAPNQDWPTAQPDRADAVRITFTAGYGATAASVPAPIRAAALLMVGSMYEFREADGARALTENPAVSRLLSPYRVYWI